MKALVTGGAGFIGAHLVEGLLSRGHAVRVLDDLFSGFPEDVAPPAELTIGSVIDEDVVRAAVEGVEIVFHLAAHRSVPRSVDHPLETDLANVHGTITVLAAAQDAHVRRVVYASSSSVYGATDELPTPESTTTQPRSPYAVSKLAGEQYCRVFTEVFGLETTSLRYFNVYGPRQPPGSQYAGVIPLFVDALRNDERLVVHGDGKQSRDFTYVDDAVTATLAAADAPGASGRVYNVAGGGPHSLLELLEVLGRLLDTTPRPEHVGARPGDVRRTWADSEAARRDLGFSPAVSFEDGLRRTVDWDAS
jgi:UDP-N-acetylglucosamine/UDP-N-acetyl-alpha-D-glucosaminouronate 4-epimerase